LSEQVWLKSSFSDAGGNNCVEVAATAHGIALRESDSPTEIITTERGAMRALIRVVGAGELTPTQA
jgi:hypothetical protein